MSEQRPSICQSIVNTGAHFNTMPLHARPQMREESLPFTVRLVQNEEDLEKAIRVRHSAYARHLPALAQTLREPEALDNAPGVAILLAESKLDGSPLGTARLQSNLFQSLAVEQSLDLPEWLDGQAIVEVTRLAIADGRAGRLVKALLMKAMYQYWLKNDIDYAIATGRAPLDRQYEQLFFTDVFPGQGFIPLRHVANVPHRVMGVRVDALEQLWSEAHHPLHPLVFLTHHPDIDLSENHYTTLLDPQRRMPAISHERMRA